MLNRSIRFCKSEMSMLMKYKTFLLDNKNDIKKTDGAFKAITAKCMMNRSVLFRESKMLSKLSV